MPDENDDGSVPIETDDLNEAEPFTPAQQVRVNQLMGDARRQGRRQVSAPGGERPPSRLDRIETALETILTGGGSAQPARPVAAAPSAPSKVDPLTTHGGLINVLELPQEMFTALVQSGGLRNAFDTFNQHGQRSRGAPPPSKHIKPRR